LRLWSVGPSGYDTPMEDFLPAYRDVLKSTVCDKLGLDVDEVIAEMIKNQEFYAYDMGDGTALLYTYYIVHDKHLWFSDVYWENNEKYGGMYETMLTVNLNETFDVEYSFDNLNHKDINVIEYPSSTGFPSYCRYKCKEKTTVDDCHVYELYQPKTFKQHVRFRTPDPIIDQCSLCSDIYHLFTTEEECRNHVNDVFSKDNELVNKKEKLLKKHKESINEYNSTKAAFEKADKSLKALKKEYFELTGEQI